MKIQNYVLGNWEDGEGEEFTALNAINGDLVGTVSSAGLDYKAILDYGRSKGGPALRKMTFQERGRMLKALAMHLMTKKNDFYAISAKTGATRIDSWIDIEGGIGNLFANASLRRQFPDLPYYVDGTAAPLSKGGTFIGHHIMVPRKGVAVHINAFNFPIWGMLEKIAVNLMAGVPAVVKPSEITSYVTEAMVREIIASKILPEGSLQLVSGLGRGIIDHVNLNDIVTFTGSAHTGKVLKSLPQIIDNSVPFNLEADSLNACVLGEDAVPGTPEYDIFIKEVLKEITIKAGQKCTAVRRILVPEKLVEDVEKSLTAKLAKTAIGDPSMEGVRMGSIVSRKQMESVKHNVSLLLEEQSLIFGDLNEVDIIGGSKEKGAFMSPLVMRNDDPFNKTKVHDIEAFGPVSTIMPYKNLDEAVQLVELGKGSLVTSIITADDN